jgi:hypothetical protein
VSVVKQVIYFGTEGVLLYFVSIVFPAIDPFQDSYPENTSEDCACGVITPNLGKKVKVYYNVYYTYTINYFIFFWQGKIHKTYKSTYDFQLNWW